MASFVVAELVSSLLVLQLAALMASHAAAVPAEVYWSSVLPKTPMPNAIKDLLPSALVGVEDEKMAAAAGTHVGVGKGGVFVDANKPGKGSADVNIGHGGVGVDVVGKGGAGNTHVVVSKGGVVGVRTSGGKRGAKPVVVDVGHAGTNNPFNYLYAATETQLHDDPRIAFFFLEKDLRRGSQMRLHFPAASGSNGGKFVVSRKEADSIPFSSGELPECKAAVVKGETRLCATSLESMVEFATSSLGTRDVAAVSTTVAGGAPAAPEQRYRVVSTTTNEGLATEAVACHARPYLPYAVFYCHATRASRVYEVELVGEDDGTAVAAAAVCHSDTAAWNPRHLAFQVLKVKPGGAPVCHFLPQDHVVWTRKVNALYP